MFNLKFSPELIFMLPFALALDVAGLLIASGIGDDYGMVDIIGIVFIFSWLIIRGKKRPSLQGKKGPMGFLRKIFTGKWSKFITPAIGELTPVVGSVGFFWTASVLFTLTEAEDEPEPEKTKNE